MSGHTEDDRDLLAGAYALGVLDRDEAEGVAAAAVTDPALRAAITEWDNRMAPMAALIAPVTPPPTLWARIASTAGVGAMGSVRGRSLRPSLLERTWRSTPFWRGATAAALALAAVFAGVTFLRPAPQPERLAAALAPPGVPGAVFLAEVQPDGSMLIRPLSQVSVQSGKDLELWALPAGATKPVSLGVMPPVGRNLTGRDLLAPQTQLMISLEPQGGSPTGAPTGPVLWGGTLAQLD